MVCKYHGPWNVLLTVFFIFYGQSLSIQIDVKISYMLQKFIGPFKKSKTGLELKKQRNMRIWIVRTVFKNLKTRLTGMEI